MDHREIHVGPPCLLATYEELKKTHNLPDLNAKSGSDYEIARVPKRPELAGYDDRLNTFVEWPISLAVTAEELAMAGLFYKGFGDKVECYCCGVIFKQWLPGDDPWKAHARWFDACKYLRTHKGTDFINQAKLSVSKTNYWDRENESCKICYTNKKEVVYIPCGHIVACKKCGTGFTNCPACRSNVKDIIQIFYC